MISAGGMRREDGSMYNRVDAGSIGSWIEILVSEGFLAQPEHLLVRSGREIIGIAPGTDLKGKGTPGIVRYSFNDVLPGELLTFYASVFLKYPAVGAILLSTAPYTVACAERGANIYPLLDDMAQMAGTKLKCVPQKLRPALAGRPAVLVKGRGALCFSSGLYDLHALAMVCEKSCLAAVGSSILGGARPIPLYEALAMRLVYRMKYSREAGKNGSREPAGGE